MDRKQNKKSKKNPKFEEDDLYNSNFTVFKDSKTEKILR